MKLLRLALTGNIQKREIDLDWGEHKKGNVTIAENW